MASQTDEHPAVSNFREYLRIPSVHPNVNYDACIDFLKKQAKQLDLPYQIFYVVPKKPILVLTWEGQEPSLPAVLLNSHMDVVPVYPEKWTHPPFAAEKDEKGNIYARGAQDMKNVAIQYLEAVRKLKKDGVKLRRNVHISFVPDEEIGGVDGMKHFVHTQDFRNLNVGFAMDEGVANPQDFYALFHTERSSWRFYVPCLVLDVHCPGKPGHGSLHVPNTAGEKLRVVLDRFMDFREREGAALGDSPITGNITTVNLTMVAGGVQRNVVPPEMSASFDIRVAPHVDHEEFEAMIRSWCAEAGSDVRMEFKQKDPKVGVTKLDDSNPWWVAFKKVSDEMKLKLKPLVCPGATDCRFVRNVGIPAIGFSPMMNTPTLLHDHDEYLSESVFLRGIEIYCHLIPALANVQA